MTVKANLLSSMIFRMISRHRCKLLARNNEIFQDIRFETRSRCNGRCDFCPVSIEHETRPDIWMSEKCYQKVVDELADMDYRGGVRYYNSNEPLMDFRLPDFLAYLQSKKLNLKYVFILTNGTLLTPSLGESLFDNGLTGLTVNDYFYSDKVSLRIKKAVEHLQKRYPDRKINLVHRSRHGVLHNRAGHAPNKPVAVKIRAGCTRPFIQFLIVPSGDVGLCCEDVYVNNPLGNVNVSSLREIWNGGAWTFLRQSLLRGNRTPFELCRVCEHKGYTNPPGDNRLWPRVTWYAADRLNRQITNDMKAEVGKPKDLFEESEW